MSNPRVLICYSPRLYAELFSSVLNSVCGIEVIYPEREIGPESLKKSTRRDADIIITSIDEFGSPVMNGFPANSRSLKVLAFSPTGKLGLRRMPDSNHWEEISPFGLEQLIREVITVHPRAII